MAVRNFEQLNNIVKRYYTLLLREGFPVEKIFLFGSCSKNQQAEGSDIDIAVILRKYSVDRFTTRLELMKFSREFVEVIEPHPFLFNEFNSADPFAAEIIKSGIEIHTVN